MIELTNAQFSDHVAIAKLHSESWQQNYRGILSDRFLDDQVEQDRANAWYKRLKFPDKNQLVTIATLDQNIVGFSCLYLDDDPVFGSYLDNLHISTGAQKSGIGTLLMKECVKQIIEKSESKKMYLWVFELNKNARKFYERLSGTNFETVEKETFDGTRSRVCRYVWNDISIII